MKQINKTIREYALGYHTEWQAMWDDVKKMNRNDRKFVKYAVDARQRLDQDGQDYAQGIISGIVRHRENLRLGFDMHKEEASRIRATIISLNPYKK